MDEKLPLPTQIGLNSEQKNEVPDNAQNIYEIKNNTPVSIKNGNDTAIVSPISIPDFPTIDLPSAPIRGTNLNIVQGRNNRILVQGNGKNILINYIKRSDSKLATFSGTNALIESGAAYAPKTPSSCTIGYNGTEWQNLDTCILVNVSEIKDEESLVASSSYGMPEEAYTSPILLTFTYTDSIGRLYSNKSIQMTSNNANAVINPTETKTDINGEAFFNVGCTVAATNVTFTANFIDLNGSPASLNVVINFYEDDSTITAPEYVYIGAEEGKITVTIKDTNNDVYPGKNVGCSSDQPLDVITVTGNPTNGSGQSFFSITTTEPHVSIISAENKTDGYNLENHAQITFISTPPTPEPPLVSLVARFESDYGVIKTGTNVDSWTDNGYGNILYYSPDDPSQVAMQYDGSLTPSGINALHLQAPTRYYNNSSNIPYNSDLDYTICMVQKIQNIDGIYLEFGMGLNACYALMNTIVFYGSGNYYMYVDKGCEGFPFSVSIMNDWYSFVYKIKNNGGTSNVDFYINNNYITTSTLSAIDPLAPDIHLFRYNAPGYDSYFGGIYVYTKILDGTEMTQLNNYVVSKYGITT